MYNVYCDCIPHTPFGSMEILKGEYGGYKFPDLQCKKCKASLIIRPTSLNLRIKEFLLELKYTQRRR